MNKKINMKYFLILVLTIGFMGCKNSTKSKILGTWDFSYSNDEISVSGTTTFSEGKDQHFQTEANAVSLNGRYNCKFSASGDFRITENNMLSLRYSDIRFYDHSNYGVSEIKAILRKLKHQTFSHDILSLDSETMIISDINTYEKITYIRSKTKEIFDDHLIEFQTKLSADLPCYESGKLSFVKMGDSKKINAAVKLEDKWTTVLQYKGSTLVAAVHYDGINKQPVVITADVDCKGGSTLPDKKTKSKYVNYGSIRLGFDPQTYEMLRELHNGGR